MSNQQQNPFNGGRPTPPQGQKKGPKFKLTWLYGFIAIALAFLYFKGGDEPKGLTKHITYSEFKEYVSKGYAEKVVAYDDNKVELTIIPDSAAHIFGQGVANSWTRLSD